MIGTLFLFTLLIGLIIAFVYSELAIIHPSFLNNRSRRKYPDWWKKFDAFVNLHEKWGKLFDECKDLRNEIDKEIANIEKYLPATEIPKRKIEVEEKRSRLFDLRHEKDSAYVQLVHDAWILKGEQGKIFCSDDYTEATLMPHMKFYAKKKD
jgi:hypothetical protein